MKKVFFIACILSLPLAIWAQTVTVDASLASPDNISTFNSLQTAITSFQASGDVTAGTDGSGVGKNHGNATSDAIHIITAVPIDEAIFIDAEAASASGLHILDEDLVIQGQGVNAIVALKQSGFGAVANDCGFFFRQDVNLTLEHIIFMPSAADAPTDDGLFFMSRINGVHTTITVDNVMVTANNGSNAPIISTGLEDGVSVEVLLDAAGTVGFGDSAIDLVSRTEGGSITMNATNLVVSAFNKSFTMLDPRTGEGNNDAFFLSMEGDIKDIINAFLNLGEGCVISQTPRRGVTNNNGGYVKVNGSDTNPVIFYNCHSDGIFNTSNDTSPTQATICEVNNCIMVNFDNSGLKEQETFGRGFVKSVTNTIIANSKLPGIQFHAFGALPPGVTSTAIIDNVTFHNCGYAAGTNVNYDFRASCVGSPRYKTTSFSNRNIAITNTIISGAGLTGIYNSSSGAYDVDYSALVTQDAPGYEYALAVETAGPGAINLGSHVINDNPCYITWMDTDVASADFMDVDNTAFGGKGTTGSNLSGGADYIGGTSALHADASWSLYE
ncbi:hypothetical protein JW926_17465 [Candidatus Sumerlaeota bacterium]|nr:hypothetical protein [Candidatus Sumerlaeota bacterium]